MTTPVNAPKTCFISYAQDDDALEKWVEDLARDLDSEGLEVLLDVWDLRFGDDVIQYMEDAVDKSDVVLLICTPLFAQKAKAGKGGVGYEKRILSSAILHNNSNDRRLIPVLRSGEPKDSVPSYLLSSRLADFRNDAKRAEKLAELLQDIRGISRRPKRRAPLEPADPLPAPATAPEPGVPNGASEALRPSSLPSAVPIPLERRRSEYVGHIRDKTLLRNSVFVLAVRADVPPDDLGRRFPDSVTIGPIEKIAKLVIENSPGIPLMQRRTRPRELPELVTKAGTLYFSLVGSSELFGDLAASSGIALRFSWLPKLEMELWAIRRQPAA